MGCVAPEYHLMAHHRRRANWLWRRQVANGGRARACSRPFREGTARALLRLHHPKVRPGRCRPVLGKWRDASPFSI
eukprot:4104133-Prymnesium_polylepis.1